MNASEASPLPKKGSSSVSDEGFAEERDSVDAIMRTIRKGAVLLDRQAKVIGVNEHGASLLEREPDALLGHTLDELVAPLPGTQLDEAIRAARSGQDASVVVRVERPAGDTGELLCDLGLLRFGTDREHGLLVQLTDLGAVRKRQQRDRAFHAKLMQNEKMQALEQFAAGVAHELNNPLASVVGFSEMLLMEDDLSQGVAEQLRFIIEQGQRAANIIQKLSTFASPGAVSRERVSLNSVASMSLEMLELDLRSHHIRVEAALAPDLPTPVADEHQLVQVLHAIITNAIKAMHEHAEGGVLRIETSSPRSGWVRVAVRDSGPGIPTQVLPRIFDPFFTTRDVGRGAGIGLSMVYSVIKEHGGEVQALNNEDGPGATVMVELPVEQYFMEPISQEMTKLPRLLIADDDDSILALVQRALHNRGFHVETAANGAEALDKLRTGEYEVVILDLRMPKLNGDAVYARLLEERPQIARRVVFMTGDTVGARAYDFLQATKAPHIYKPFSIRTVRTVVDQIIENAKQPPTTTDESH